jgi:all-trans-retinol 13,14-reductase
MTNNNPFDTIVIGSGIGGLACASALARTGQRVLVLEQHFVAGGLTQTFSRGRFVWDVGVHYLGQMGAGGTARRVIDWLSGGALLFESMGPVYDTMHFPDGFELPFSRPESGLLTTLRDRFPESGTDIGRFFYATREAQHALQALFALRAVPGWLAPLVRLRHGGRIRRWCTRTTADVLRECVADQRLRAVLAAQRGDYGPEAGESSFAMHALVMRHYFDGAWYPMGGAKRFADTLVPVIEQAGGVVRTRAEVAQILVEAGAVTGVRLKNGEELCSGRVVSDAGAHNTVTRLLPVAWRDSAWGREIAGLAPSACHVGVYLGFDGDIRAHGATASNHWFYSSWDITHSLWRDPRAEPEAPGMFVSFPSLKDPRRADATEGHTAEIVVFTDWNLFAPWRDSRVGRRPDGYSELKQLIEERLLAQFRRHFPALAARIAHVEVSTPLSTVAFTGADEGGIYGLATSPRRFLSDALAPRTPVPGLFLAGQDVSAPGITGAMMGGMMAAASIEPRIWRRL